MAGIYAHLDPTAYLMLFCCTGVWFWCAWQYRGKLYDLSSQATKIAVPTRRRNIAPGNLRAAFGPIPNPELQAFEEQLKQRANHSQLLWLIEQSPDAMYLKNEHGQLLVGNMALARLLEVASCDELLRDWLAFHQLYYCDPKRGTILRDQLRRQRVVQHFCSRVNTRTGNQIDVSESARLIEQVGSTDCLYLVTVRQIIKPLTNETIKPEPTSLVVVPTLEHEALEQRLVQLNQLLDNLRQREVHSQTAQRILSTALELISQCQQLLSGVLPTTVAPTETITDQQPRTAAEEDTLVMTWLTEISQTIPGNTGTTATVDAALNQHLQSTQELLPTANITTITNDAQPSTEPVVQQDLEQTLNRIQALLASVDPAASTADVNSSTDARELDLLARELPSGPRRRVCDQSIDFPMLLSRCLNDQEFAWRMLGKFPSRFQRDFRALQAAVIAQDATNALARVNQLRGMVANIGAEKLRVCLGSLEAACREQNWLRVPNLITNVQSEFENCCEYLRQHGPNELGSTDSQIEEYTTLTEQFMLDNTLLKTYEQTSELQLQS